MDIRKPKPIRNWREFLVEIGTIVIGISIALTAEQAIEAVQVHDRIHEIEAVMTLELGRDEGPQALERLAISDCNAARLTRLEAELVAERDQGTPFHPDEAYQPPYHTWDEDGWHAAGSSDVASHMSIARLALWSSSYEEVPSMDRASFEEFRDAAALGDPRGMPAHPSEAERDAMLQLIRRLRGDNLFLTHASSVLLKDMQQAGVHIPPDLPREVLASARAAHGRYVRSPLPVEE